MGKIISLDPRRLAEERTPTQAVAELHQALIALNTSVAVLAGWFPGTTAIAGIVRGQPLGALAFAVSREANHCTPAAMERAKALAKIVASLPDELLQDAFRGELNLAAQIAAIKREAESK